MPTYLGNAYELLSQVRYGINDNSAAQVQGTDATGAFKNDELMHQINIAQDYLWGVIIEALPEFFLKSASLTFTASVASLPSDYFRMKKLYDSESHPIDPVNLQDKHTTDSGSAHLYYRYGSTLRIDRDGVTDTGTLWYYWKCRQLDTGMTSAGGALSATLATTAKNVADYYNNMTIENVTDSTVDTITDYSAARVATVSNTWAASKYYGIVSELPEIFHQLIAEYAILQLKKNPRCPLVVTVADVKLFAEMLQSALKSFAGTQNGDVSMDDIIGNF